MSHDDDDIYATDDRHDSPAGDIPDQRALLRHYFDQLRKHPCLTPGEERRCARGTMAGDPACRDTMIRSNLRLVIRLALRYQRRGFRLEDLVAEGNIGLIHAVDKFDPERGFRFSTYATHWIRHYIEQFIMQNARLVKVPIHLVKQMRVVSTAEKLQGLRAQPMSAEDLALLTGYSATHVKKLLTILSIREESIDQPVSEDQSMMLRDVLPDTGAVPIGQALEQEGMLDFLQTCLARQEPRLREILARRFGLLGYQASSLDEIATAIGMARETIRTSIQSGIKMLRLRLEQQGYGPITV